MSAPRKRPTRSMRVPTAVVEQARSWAPLLGFQTPGDLIAAAWDLWVANHAEELRAALRESGVSTTDRGAGHG